MLKNSSILFFIELKLDSETIPLMNKCTLKNFSRFQVKKRKLLCNYCKVKSCFGSFDKEHNLAQSAQGGGNFLLFSKISLSKKSCIDTLIVL